MKRNTFTLQAMFMALLAVALICMPVSADQEAIEIEVAEVIEHAEDFMTYAVIIQDETRIIRNDESVDQEIRDIAAAVHRAGDELELIAKDMLDDAEEIGRLAVDPIGNRAAIDHLLDHIKEDLLEYKSILDAQHDAIHALEGGVPENLQIHADAIHDTAHTAERDVRHMNRHITALSTALDAAAAPVSQPAESPGFGVLAALAGIAAVAYARRS
ncbi:PGF-CTERM protein [Methanocalculus alkaliphilus]|uniref:PGF-CTERM sorting domain-containing protein n=1 Tax=Methanocalculus alkaliphilus TaxID=768730 RepID=UPI0020A09468|nr:PGF-CTERM sorting domain-containing protein [Methanocalculus alkaliphilus]MCP1714547.1 PGF-CTERM protein [Methanocalculus alkaliphilus]